LLASDLSDAAVLAEAFSGCVPLRIAPGINREIGKQTYQKVHVQGDPECC